MARITRILTDEATAAVDAVSSVTPGIHVIVVHLASTHSAARDADSRKQ